MVEEPVAHWVLRQSLRYLRQQDLVSLALVNREFSRACYAKLLHTIHISENSPQLMKGGWGRRFDNIGTVIYGEGPQLELKLQKLLVLLQDHTNSNLISGLVHSIVVWDSFSNNRLVQLLIGEILGVCKSTGLEKACIIDHSLRKLLKPNESNPTITFAQIDSIPELIRISQTLPNVVHVKFSLLEYEDFSYNEFKNELSKSSSPRVSESLSHFFDRLQTLSCDVDLEKLNNFFWIILASLPRINLRKLRAANLNVFCAGNAVGREHLGTMLSVFTEIPYGNLTELSLTIGCDIGDDNVYLEHLFLVMDCIDSLANIRHLHIKQADEGERLNSHSKSSQWDVLIFQWLFDASMDNLIELSINPRSSPSGFYEDGMEGNFLQRLKLYTDMLPSQLGHITSHDVSLNYDTLMTIAACYEQPMNNILWNGCKCSHCKTYLEVLDTFLMTHKYYRKETNHWKDLTTCQLFVTIFDILEARKSRNSLVGVCRDFVIKRDKDIHYNTRYTNPFMCLHHQTVDEGEFEDEAELSFNGIFFDALDLKQPCGVDDRLFSHFALCMRHYVDSLLEKMLNLNRGDAEEMEIGNENDGSGTCVFSQITISGFVYSIGEEANGTNKFVCLLD
mgnify:CR=1 FL=1